MSSNYKHLTDFLRKLGIEELPHSGKSYLAHLVGVYRDLEAWGAPEEVCRAGMFHSIYGTEMFQGFKLALEQRGEVRELIGERAERLAYANCAMDRASFDRVLDQAHGPYRIVDRITKQDIELSREDYDDLCRVHLCDWLEQVPRAKMWDYRRAAFRRMAQRLAGVAQQAHDRVFAQETAVSGS
jgi:hypothetical protein